MPLRSVTIYCASASNIPQVHLDAGRELGRAIATAGWALVYGGNDVGLMGVVARGAREAGGAVIGVTPQIFVDRGVHDTACTELLVTANMRDRKALLESRGDAFVALPGGIGTFEEFFEILAGRGLGYHRKPIVLLNIAGYYSPLLELFRHGIEQRFIKPATLELFHVAETVADAIAFLSQATIPLADVDIISKG